MKAGIIVISVTCLVAGRAVAQLQPPPQIGPRSAAEVRGDEFTGSSISSEVSGDYPGALSLADEAIRANPSGAWGHYLRGAALLALRRVDEAVSSFQEAERLFPASDPWGRSVAIWGGANAFEEARPCREAAAMYERYAVFVERIDSAAAAMARKYAKIKCVPPVPAPFAQLDPAWEYYRRADALLSSHRFDEAVASYREAEQRLPDSDVWAKSIAIWGQANALKEAGRCPEASPIYERYARFVEARDPEAAAMGREYSKKHCVPLRK